MENPTSFDLNRAIGQWRKQLAQSPALRRETLDELETHLRDSIAILESNGLPKDEAFLIAIRRCGSEQQLEDEFDKLNTVETNITKLRWGIPKYRKTWSGLYALAFALMLLSGHVGVSASTWVRQLGGVTLAAAMCVMVAGMVAERREWERKHPQTE